MKFFGLFFLLSWLLQSSLGRLLLLAAGLWYLDNRYFGILAMLWAPVARMQRIGGLKASVASNPTDIRSMVELGEHFLRAGQPQPALEWVERAIERGEDSARALFIQGAALVELKRYEDGQAKLSTALELNADLFFGEPYLYLLQEALATEGLHGDRIGKLVAGLQRYDSVEVLTRAGQLLTRAGRSDLGKPLLEAALQNFSYTPKGMRRRARRWAFRARLALMLTRADA